MSEKQCADSMQSAAGGTRLKSEGTIRATQKFAPSTAPSSGGKSGSSQGASRGKQG
jgi:hypothetical protein